MGRVEFTDNVEDLSTASGFQFKFVCESCGNGYQSTWRANPTGIAGSVLRTAGGLLGGIFGRRADVRLNVNTPTRSTRGHLGRSFGWRADYSREWRAG